MKHCMVRDLFPISFPGNVRISLLKWLAVAGMLIFILLFDTGNVLSAATAIPKQSDPGESPPDYATSRVVGAMKVGGSSVVVFEDAKGEQTTYRTGETFADGSKIVAVHANSIIVRLSDGSKVEYFVTPIGAGKAGAAPTSRPVAASPVPASPPPAYVPPPAPVSSEPASGRAPKRRRQRPASSDVDE
jgi:hypothetical protein